MQAKKIESLVLNEKDLVLELKCGKTINVYNEIKPVPGVYICYNKFNKKAYFGMSNNILKRIKTHKRELEKDLKRKKSGERSHWQNSYIKYGKEAFEWYTVEYLKRKKDRELLEKFLIFSYSTRYAEYGYNKTLGGDGIDSETVKEYWKNQGVFYSSEGVSIAMVHKMIGPWGTINKSVEEINEIINKNESLFIEYPDKLDEKYTNLIERMADSILTNNQDDNYPCNIQRFEEKLERESWSQVEDFDLEDLLKEEELPPSFNNYDFTNYEMLKGKVGETSAGNFYAEGLIYFRPYLDPNDEFSFTLIDLQSTIEKSGLNDFEKDVLDLLRDGYTQWDAAIKLGTYQKKISRAVESIIRKIQSQNNKYDSK